MKIRNLILCLLFAFIVLEVLFNSFDHATVPEFIFKPLIMVWIAFYSYSQSDSLIAVNKFAVKIPHSGFWMMSSYILAQLLMMIGLVAQVRNNIKSQLK